MGTPCGRGHTATYFGRREFAVTLGGAAIALPSAARAAAFDAGGRFLDRPGIGDFFGNGTKDVLWFNSTSGDTGFWSIATNGTVTGWHDLGTAGSGYTPVGIGDYLANNTSDVLFANASGDTGYWIISNGTVTTWHDLGNSGAGYGVLSPPGDSMDTPSLTPGTPLNGTSPLPTSSDPVSPHKV